MSGKSFLQWFALLLPSLDNIYWLRINRLLHSIAAAATNIFVLLFPVLHLAEHGLICLNSSSIPNSRSGCHKIFMIIYIWEPQKPRKCNCITLCRWSHWHVLQNLKQQFLKSFETKQEPRPTRQPLVGFGFREHCSDDFYINF